MDITWLDTLEEKVHLATERIRELKEESRGLREQLEEAGTASEPNDWESEKNSIRERVEKLAAGLKDLLGED